jgi:hypothetical protein
VQQHVTRHRRRPACAAAVVQVERYVYCGHICSQYQTRGNPAWPRSCRATLQAGIQTTCLKDSTFLQLCLRALTQNEWALGEGKRSRLLALFHGCEVGDYMATCMRGLSDIQAALPAIHLSPVSRLLPPVQRVGVCVRRDGVGGVRMFAMWPEELSISRALHRGRSTRTFSHSNSTDERRAAEIGSSGSDRKAT